MGPNNFRIGLASIRLSLIILAFLIFCNRILAIVFCFIKLEFIIFNCHCSFFCFYIITEYFRLFISTQNIHYIFRPFSWFKSSITPHHVVNIIHQASQFPPVAIRFPSHIVDVSPFYFTCSSIITEKFFGFASIIIIDDVRTVLQMSVHILLLILRV